MMEIELKRAYIAGLVDGEGCILIKRRLPTSRNRMRTPKYAASFSIAMTDEAPVRMVANYVGNPESVGWRDRPGCKRIFEYEIENSRAVNLIREVMPYLVGKRRQAELVLEFSELKATSRSHRTKVLGVRAFSKGRNAGGEYRVLGMSDEFVDRCEVIYRQVNPLNPKAGHGVYFPEVRQ